LNTVTPVSLLMNAKELYTRIVYYSIRLLMWLQLLNWHLGQESQSLSLTRRVLHTGGQFLLSGKNQSC
jgi:hypothetical protein